MWLCFWRNATLICCCSLASDNRQKINYQQAFINGDWWVTGVSVFDAITSQPLTYDTSQSGRRLHENAIIYHKGCLPSYLVQED